MVLKQLELVGWAAGALASDYSSPSHAMSTATKAHMHIIALEIAM